MNKQPGQVRSAKDEAASRALGRGRPHHTHLRSRCAISAFGGFNCCHHMMTALAGEGQRMAAMLQTIRRMQVVAAPPSGSSVHYLKQRYIQSCSTRLNAHAYCHNVMHHRACCRWYGTRPRTILREQQHVRTFGIEALCCFEQMFIRMHARYTAFTRILHCLTALCI